MTEKRGDLLICVDIIHAVTQRTTTLTNLIKFQMMNNIICANVNGTQNLQSQIGLLSQRRRGRRVEGFGAVGVRFRN